MYTGKCVHWSSLYTGKCVHESGVYARALDTIFDLYPLFILYSLYPGAVCIHRGGRYDVKSSNCIHWGSLTATAADMICGVSNVYSGAMCIPGQCVHLGSWYTGRVCALGQYVHLKVHTQGQCVHWGSV